jgi:hypothetical protein
MPTPYAAEPATNTPCNIGWQFLTGTNTSFSIINNMHLCEFVKYALYRLTISLHLSFYHLLMLRYTNKIYIDHHVSCDNCSCVQMIHDHLLLLTSDFEGHKCPVIYQWTVIHPDILISSIQPPFPTEFAKSRPTFPHNFYGII